MEASRARKELEALTAGDKRDICQREQAHPPANLNATLNWIHHDMGLDIAKATLCTVLKDAGMPSDFQYSSGWLLRFKARHKIPSHRIHGESGDVDPTTVSEGRERLHRVLQRYSLDDIYNFDETALFFKLGPTRTLSANRVPGTKRRKVRVTAGLLCYASGTDNCKPNAQRPSDFGKKFSPAQYFHYYANRKAWMTSDIFSETLRRFDNRLKQENSKRYLWLTMLGVTSCAANS
ncbi:tigger transposable element-derived protein 6-like [Ornithodoros turicata]|uniref:tigger transposable element-derived protein 6-like n=1 Tax=Ornithodoros turicata TaxID=34597 RepID=UPI0031389842